MNGGEQVSHGPALLNINTGSGVFARPSLGAWTLYGVGTEPTDEYARQCLQARRLLEAGVRFVQINFSDPRNDWDAHGDLRNNHTTNAKKVDQPIAAFLTDLKSRGMLDDTLVIFGTEFGRTPAAQGTDGRDHHPHAFSIWLAGRDHRLTDVDGEVIREILV